VIPRLSDTWRCSRLGRATCNRENMGERRTDERPRPTASHDEPASRATRWALFALRLRRIEGGTPCRELGRPLSFTRSKERKQVMGRRPRRRAVVDTNCAQHQPL
jgi:hypothetical protein